MRLAGSPSDGRSSGWQIIFKQHLTGVVILTISVSLVKTGVKDFKILDLKAYFSSFMTPLEVRFLRP